MAQVNGTPELAEEAQFGAQKVHEMGSFIDRLRFHGSLIGTLVGIQTPAVTAGSLSGLTSSRDANAGGNSAAMRAF